jgi:transcriptional regulator with XRE-family HTH domain
MSRSPQRNRLRAWRENLGLTQSQLAGRIDTTGAVISLLESGDRPLSEKWLRRIAPALGITEGWLVKRWPEEIEHA